MIYVLVIVCIEYLCNKKLLEVLTQNGRNKQGVGREHNRVRLLGKVPPPPSPGYIVLTPICYCRAEIKINSFVSCDLFISQSAGLWLSVTLMEKLKLYYQMIRLCQVVFYSLIFLVQGEVLES